MWRCVVHQHTNGLCATGVEALSRSKERGVTDTQSVTFVSVWELLIYV